jgi:hypothetical protein
MNMDNTLCVTCNKCGHRYELKPVHAFPPPSGGGVYSSDKDHCPECESMDLHHIFKDGRPCSCHGKATSEEPLLPRDG